MTEAQFITADYLKSKIKELDAIIKRSENRHFRYIQLKKKLPRAVLEKFIHEHIKLANLLKQVYIAEFEKL